MKKKIYLTIDDAPSLDFLAKLDYLKSQKIPAVLFCIGNLLEKRPAMAVQAINAGYLIANHSYTHPHFSGIPLDRCFDEIKKTDIVIEELYKTAKVKRPAKWFRFPYGDKGDKKYGKTFSLFRFSNQKRKDKIQKYLRDLGYTQPDFEGVDYKFMTKAGLFEDVDWSWTFDIMEWAMQEKRSTLGIKNIKKVLSRMKSQRPADCRGFLGFEKRWLASTSDEIVLFHDQEGTSPYFEMILNELANLPIEFTSVKL